MGVPGSCSEYSLVMPRDVGRSPDRREDQVGGLQLWRGKTLVGMSEPDNNEAERDSNHRASLKDPETGGTNVGGSSVRKVGRTGRVKGVPYRG